MDSLAAVSAGLQQVKLDQDISVAVLKKSLQIQSEGAQALLQALPQPQYSNPPNLGSKIDVKV